MYLFNKEPLEYFIKLRALLAGLALVFGAGAVLAEAQYPRKDLELAKSFPKEQVVWLKSDTGQFLSLYQPQSRGIPQGGAILLHPRGHDANSTDVIMSLRHQLTDFGWHTLSISLPSNYQEIEALLAEQDGEGAAQANGQDDQAAPKVASKADKETEAESTIEFVEESKRQVKTLTPELTKWGEEVSSRINAAFKFLNSKGQFNLVMVTHGIGAVWALKYAAESAPKSKGLVDTSQAIIMIDPTPTEFTDLDGYVELDLLELIPKQKTPILDIYTQVGYSEQKWVRRRKDASKRARLTDYRQVRVVKGSINNFALHERLSKRIGSWLSVNARAVQGFAKRD